MLINRLQVSQFRCWSYREVEFDREITYLTGSNSAGKTSLVEAINYLSTGRSFRTRRDRRLIQWEKSYYSLRGEFSDGPVEDIAVSYEKTPAGSLKQIKVDGELLSRLSRLQGLFPVVLFSPEQLEILTGGPKNRRRFINQLICQYSPEYIRQLQIYNRALDQRNSLLKNNNPDPDLLETYEKKMAPAAGYIITQRRKLLARLQDWLAEHIKELAGEILEEITINYRPGIGDSEDSEDIAEKLVEERKKAIKTGYTTFGIQRDDWQISRADEHSLRNSGARGELRVTLIALKYAAAGVIDDCSAYRPVLLFDDLLSELDSYRQSHVINYGLRSKYQVIFTGTKNPDEFDLPRPGCVVELPE